MNVFNLFGIAFFLAFFLYFIPGIVASVRHHHNASAIIALNILLGWTVIGWVASLVWALTVVQRPVAPPEQVRAAPPDLSFDIPPPRERAGTAASVAKQIRCTECNSIIDAETQKCPHCGTRVIPEKWR